MPAENFFTFHPERIVWYGLTILAVLTGALLPFAHISDSGPPSRLTEVKRTKALFSSGSSFDFSLSSSPPGEWICPIPDVRNQMMFSFDPPRPDGENQLVQLSIRMKQHAKSKRYSIPCRIDLEYRGNALTFSETESPFWLEINEGLIGTVFVDGRPGDPFPVVPQECPFQGSQEFPEGSPFRILSEGRWWGHDLFRKNHGGGKVVHRIELGALTEAELLDTPEGGWIVFRNGLWECLPNLHEAGGHPIAVAKEVGPSGLEIEGWDGNQHVRLALASASTSLFKVKGEELFSAIRIRSDKQISCTLDKQCLILKVGDWVLKTGNRWKLLRKPEEKEAFLSGKWAGELFVLDQISNKQGQKSISGHFYNLSRTQTVSVDLPVLARKSLSARRNELPDLKAKGKAR
ncbi:MAG: hypothetical protein JSS32_01555 [Verrucomicrobia bacterium]|nr:hypothetical protein [Verrucomicrobiota bacterium]